VNRTLAAMLAAAGAIGCLAAINEVNILRLVDPRDSFDDIGGIILRLETNDDGNGVMAGYGDTYFALFHDGHCSNSLRNGILRLCFLPHVQGKQN